MNLQSKLLRIIEYGELRRLGDESMQRVNIRVLAATNQDLPGLIAEKKFREDLFFRINVIHIHIPSLRERKEDIPLLLRFYIERYNKAQSKNIMGMDAKARAILMQYEYPGNVRELDNIIQHAFAMADGDIITAGDLPVHLQEISPVYRLEAHGGHTGGRGSGDGGELLLSEAERGPYCWLLTGTGRTIQMSQRRWGISRSTLWRKIKEYKIKY